MTQRESQILWLKDLFSHLHDCHEQLIWADEKETARILLESMIQDLDRGKRLCEAILSRSPSPSPKKKGIFSMSSS